MTFEMTVKTNAGYYLWRTHCAISYSQLGLNIFLGSLKSNLYTALTTYSTTEMTVLYKTHKTQLHFSPMCFNWNKSITGQQRRRLRVASGATAPDPALEGAPRFRPYEFVKLYSPVNWKCCYMLRLKSFFRVKLRSVVLGCLLYRNRLHVAPKGLR